MDTQVSALELIHRAPSRRTRKPALLFVHGAYVGAWCWDIHFLRYLASRGFPSYALSLRGHGASAHTGDFAALGIDDYVEDVERVVQTLGGGPTMLIGHSMGALVVTRLLARRSDTRARIRGAVLLAPVPRLGLAPALMALAFRSPLLLAELQQVQFGRPRYHQLTQIRRALFSAGVEEALVRSYFVRMQRESQRALLEMSMLHFIAVRPVPGAPLLVLGAANDGFFAPELISASALGLGSPCEIFSDMAHAMMLEPRWRDVADRIAAWAEQVIGLP